MSTLILLVFAFVLPAVEVVLESSAHQPAKRLLVREYDSRH